MRTSRLESLVARPPRNHRIYNSHFGGRVDQANVVEFYDRYVERQLAGAYNRRHLILIDRMRGLGLSADSSVREIGCGIGVMTSLLAETVTRGRIVATDISPQSVEAASALNQDASNRIAFRSEPAGDLVQEREAYDFVCMFDVLEHVPIAEHETIFAAARGCMRESGLFVVSIPSPAGIRYLREHQPDALQPIDHDLEVATLTGLASRVGLALHRFEEFDAWQEDQYHLFAFRRVREYLATPSATPDPSSPFLMRVRRHLRLRRAFRALSPRR